MLNYPATVAKKFNIQPAAESRFWRGHFLFRVARHGRVAFDVAGESPGGEHCRVGANSQKSLCCPSGCSYPFGLLKRRQVRPENSIGKDFV